MPFLYHLYFVPFEFEHHFCLLNVNAYSIRFVRGLESKKLVETN